MSHQWNSRSASLAIPFLLCNFPLPSLQAVKQELTVTLALLVQAVTVVGSSMGASIIWAYIELYGHDRLARAIFVDQVTLRHRLNKAGWAQYAAMIMGPGTVGGWVSLQVVLPNNAENWKLGTAGPGYIGTMSVCAGPAAEQC